MSKIAGNRYSVGPASISLYPAAGGSDDWAKGILRLKYTYTVELGDTGRHGFILPASHIKGAGDEAIAFMETVGKAMAKA